MKRFAAESPSSYYPPRARWNSPVLRLNRSLKRRLRLEKIHLPRPGTVLGIILGLVVPGLAFYRSGRRIVARCIFAGCGTAAVAFVVELGHPLANWAFMVLISAHVASVTQQIMPVASGRQLAAQLVMSVVLFAGISQLVYVPAREWFYWHVALPLQTPRGTVVVDVRRSPAAIQRGDWAAYRIEGSYGGGIQVRAGYGYGVVLAVAGDRVQYGPAGCRINGVPIPRMPHMPASGEITIPENHWFIWPDLAIGGHGGVPEEEIAAAIQNRALVSRGDLMGKAFDRWFFRRQVSR